MARYIILAIVVTIIVMVLLLMLIGAVYQAGKESVEKEYKIKQAALEDTIQEYQDKLAQIRVERKLAKKGGDSPR